MQTSAWAALRADLKANPRDPKSWLIVVLLRGCQALIGEATRPPVHSWPAIAVYRFLTEFMLGVELRPTTEIGPGLTIYHGTGLVVNDHATIGSRVKLRNGVVIGNKAPNGPCPRIGDDVEVGAGAIIIGDISIGPRAVIGAGSVVISDVPADDVVAGNPARSIRRGRVNDGSRGDQGAAKH